MTRPPHTTPILTVLAVMGILAGVWLATKLFALIALLLVALILATGIHPVVEWIHQKAFPRWLAILSVLLTLVVASITVFYFTATALWNEGSQAWSSLPEYSDTLNGWLKQLHEHFPQLPSTQSLLDSAREQIGKIGDYLWQTTAAVLGVLGGLGSALTVLVLTFYLLLEKEMLGAAFLSLIPPKHRPVMEKTTLEALETMGGWLRGQTILVGAMLIVITVAMSVLGVPSPLLIGVVGALGELVPMVGPIAAAILAVPLAFFSMPLWVGMVTASFFVVLSVLEGNVIVPKVMEKSVNLSPFFTVLAVLAGATLYGALGALLAVPLASAARIYLKRIVVPSIQKGREIGSKFPLDGNRAVRRP